jgi:hypothetical protein
MSEHCDPIIKCNAYDKRWYRSANTKTAFVLKKELKLKKLLQNIKGYDLRKTTNKSDIEFLQMKSCKLFSKT